MISMRNALKTNALRHMKKLLIPACLVIVVAIDAAVGFLIFQGVTITDPYIIKPTSQLPARGDANVGHTIKTGTHTLSVVSRKNVVVIADPGASFKYEVLWLVKKPREDRSDNPVEYQYALPEYALAEHINPIGSETPPKIQRVAEGRW